MLIYPIKTGLITWINEIHPQVLDYELCIMFLFI